MTCIVYEFFFWKASVPLMLHHKNPFYKVIEAEIKKVKVAGNSFQPLFKSYTLTDQ